MSRSHFFQGQHPPTAHPGKLTDPHPPHFWSTSKIFKAACHCRFCPKALIRLVAQRVPIVTVPSAHNRQEMWFLAVWCHSELVEISWKYKNMRRKGWALTSIKPISRGLISVDSLSEQLARNKKKIFSILCSIHTPNLTKRKKKPSTGLEMHSNFSTTFLLPSLWLHCETIYLFVQWNCIHWQLCVWKKRPISETPSIRSFRPQTCDNMWRCHPRNEADWSLPDWSDPGKSPWCLYGPAATAFQVGDFSLRGGKWRKHVVKWKSARLQGNKLPYHISCKLWSHLSCPATPICSMTLRCKHLWVIF